MKENQSEEQISRYLKVYNIEPFSCHDYETSAWHTKLVDRDPSRIQTLLENKICI